MPPSYTPTPAQQNPAVRRTLAPTLPPEDQRAPNPVAEQRERQKAAIESRIEGHEYAQRGGFGGAATPPKQPSAKPSPSGSPPASTPKSTSGDTSSASTGAATAPSAQGAPAAKPPASTPKPSDEPATDGSASSGAATPAQILSFTPKEFKKWAAANPEEALAFREAIDKDSFRVGEDAKQEWIRLTQRGRKLRDEHRTRREELDREMSTREAAARDQLQLAEKTVNDIRFLSEMWGAANGKDASGNRVIDFDQVDEAFKQNSGGLSIDEYVRARARRGVSNPEAARLRSELRRKELELERTKTNGAAGATSGNGGSAAATELAQPAAPAAPAGVSPGLHANPEEYWGDEVPAEHPLRRLNGWGKLLDHAMLQYHDDVLDEYSRDADEIAGEIFQREVAKLTGGGEPEKVAVKPHARNKPATPKNRQAAIRKSAPEEDGAPTNVRGIGIPAGKLVPRGQVNQDRSHYVIPQEKWGDVVRHTGGIENVTRSAIERAKLRAKGIDPDTGEAWEG